MKKAKKKEDITVVAHIEKVLMKKTNPTIFSDYELELLSKGYICAYSEFIPLDKDLTN